MDKAVTVGQFCHEVDNAVGTANLLLESIDIELQDLVKQCQARPQSKPNFAELEDTLDDIALCLRNISSEISSIQQSCHALKAAKG